jgi:hypothetical protein
MTDVPIMYVLVDENRDEGRAHHSIFHLLRESEITLLRCFMTLLFLPSSSSRIVTKQQPFLEAIDRLLRLPSFRKANSQQVPVPKLWDNMISLPLVVLMIGETLPIWFESLILLKNIAVLSQSDKVIASAAGSGRAFAGLLRGMEDIREFYRVIGQLAAAQATSVNDPDTQSSLMSLTDKNLFQSRPRLSFIPNMPLPPPSIGRPAAYLLNRLSNNVDEPHLAPEGSGNGGIFPQLLKALTLACTSLALIETNKELPPDYAVARPELSKIHSKLISESTEDKAKLDTLTNLGYRLVEDRKGMGPSFFTIPVPRLDLIHGNVPEGIQLEADFKESIRSNLQAVDDFTSGTKKGKFKNKGDEQRYEQAQRTLISEQRLVACQTAYLAGSSGTTPIQLPPIPGRLYNAFNDLRRALDTNSRKIPSLFRGIEILLSKVLPKDLIELFNEGESSVTLFSDLPFEWALIDEWPLCLTRPVARIPIAMSNWDMLSAALQHPATIDVKKPERVLVLDLIPSSDSVRGDSDAFITSSKKLGQNYTYVSPSDAEDLKNAISIAASDIIVLDAHGRYNVRKDELSILVGGNPVPLDDLLPDNLVPPVWILSACDTSVTGAIRGCFVRKLLARGAVCVIATLSRVDAFTASMFIGRLLTDIYNPVNPGSYSSLDEVFFITQYTTALLYDPLLPLIRRSERDAALKEPLANVFGGFIGWASQQQVDIKTYKHEIAWVLGKLLAENGLTSLHESMRKSGHIRPETLLFSAFGVPHHVELVGSQTQRNAAAECTSVLV